LFDKNLLFRQRSDTERRLVFQGNFNTTRCGGVGYDSGRAKRIAKITSKDLQGDVDSGNFGMAGRFFGKFGQT
jgi:hypothetical protein